MAPGVSLVQNDGRINHGMEEMMMEEWVILWPDGSLLRVYGPQEIELPLRVVIRYPQHANAITGYPETVAYGGLGKGAVSLKLEDGRVAVAILLSVEEDD